MSHIIVLNVKDGVTVVFNDTIDPVLDFQHV